MISCISYTIQARVIFSSLIYLVHGILSKRDMDDGIVKYQCFIGILALVYGP